MLRTYTVLLLIAHAHVQSHFYYPCSARIFWKIHALINNTDGFVTREVKLGYFIGYKEHRSSAERKANAHEMIESLEHANTGAFDDIRTDSETHFFDLDDAERMIERDSIERTNHTVYLRAIPGQRTLNKQMFVTCGRNILALGKIVNREY
ncbi:BgtE- [Caenorhabditis elegans]|uniref:BgtE n=1 Tax=Caenorhabditis elegans TaxID=6239 RepID=Q9N5E5_CAEEL|nr:BgtE- [Caenorhabditis elegans]CCD73574.2 BgtE- [Caenorhabditis elegans]|eukprot:NP_493794.3 Uncharacterized protein CELE_T02H6.3 [Caenorhabditis elegans]